jgi:glycosyltransferase involved in cell wall biosynthesis
VVVPSLVYETFGYVVLEAFHEGTPVVVRNLGALPELVAESRGGLIFDTSEELVAAVGRLSRDPVFRDQLGRDGRRARWDRWSESAHMATYLGLIDDLRRARRARADRPHPLLRGPVRDREVGRSEILVEPAGEDVRQVRSV